MSEPLTQYLSRYIRDPEDVERSVTAPVLLYEPPELDPQHKLEHRLRTVSGVGPPVAQAGEPLVLRVRKEKDNAFRRGVTVGRTSNNDVILDDASVSRFHAWFQRDDKTGEWAVADAGSKNGTHLAGQKLRPKKLTALAKESRLRFGQVEVTFLAPVAFLRLLRIRSRS
ncbi:MAG: FHA domain-containing protein [Myxococcales bacterium]|nr:FHA domain-containing protein [Myxococcales bacterium]